MTEQRPRLPRILAERRSADAGEIDLAIDAGLVWFDGHFPGTPILPGVVQLQWALEFAERLLGVRQPAARDFQVKFKAIISPGDIVTLAISHDRGKGRVTFEFRREEEVCSTGRVTLTSDDPRPRAASGDAQRCNPS